MGNRVLVDSLPKQTCPEACVSGKRHASSALGIDTSIAIECNTSRFESEALTVFSMAGTTGPTL
jgi:hypothetical protein